MSLLMESHIAISVLLASISPPLSGRLLSVSFSSHMFSTRPVYIHLTTFLYSYLHSHFIHFLLSALITSTIILTRLFSQTWIFRCLSVSAIVSCAFMSDLSTFSLRLRDMRLSPITPSTFLLAFALAVILIVIKAINRVDWILHWENATS